MAKTDAQLRIRVPGDVKRFLETRSKRNSSSQNSEVIRCVRNEMENETAEQASYSVAPPSDHQNAARQGGNS